MDHAFILSLCMCRYIYTYSYTKFYLIIYCFSLLFQEEYTTQLVLLTEKNQENINYIMPSNTQHLSATFEQK